MDGRTLFSVCFAISVFSFTTANSASLTFVEQTRLIFNANTNAASFPIKNDTDRRFLVKASVLDISGDSPGQPNSDFLVLPEVLVLRPGKHQQLKVVRVSGNFPKDRESAFFLNGYFIPEEKKSSTDSTVNLAVSLNVKMFYRPVDIIDNQAIRKVSPLLEFGFKPGYLIVRNPSPYHLTFAKLAVNGVELSSSQLKQMVKPFACADYEISLYNTGEKEISWVLIDEYGNGTQESFKKTK